MSLLLSNEDLAARAPMANGPLKPLAKSLAQDLMNALAMSPEVPEQKALLSREGGRCAKDGAMLDFDPYSPHQHRCPVCGTSYEGELHDRFWIYWYQLWLAERTVHAATLGRLIGIPQATKFALDVLDAYSDRYLKYPNVDNALGPTRPFFSTYLESIWLLQLCVAADILDATGYSPAIGRFRERVVEPSVKLIASFNEGLSNRQVWNNAALIAAYRLLGRNGDAEAAVWGESGLVTHLSDALLSDGTWYEGENYHFFAHRGLWYCVQLASQMDAEVPENLVARFDAGFRAPFLTALPDLTFPSRRDSQYAVSLRQWRFAEMCELGLARGDDRLLRGMLARLYAVNMERGDTGRWKSTAEAERNVPATRLERSDLGWKSLLFARPEIELADPSPLPSVLLDAQGFGVIRRDAGKVYVALDYGVSGGGHGHPDRLNLLLMNGKDRILDDVGTGSYVDPSLHWYRSSLAHNAPFFDGSSQPRVNGILSAWEDRGAAGWIAARAQLGPDRHVVRRVVTMPDYSIDEVEWASPVVKTLDLPLHVDADVVSAGGDWAESEMAGGRDPEDGFRFLTKTECLPIIPAGKTVQLRATVGGKAVDLWIASDSAFELWRATGPGAPGKPVARFIVLRSRENVSRFHSLWSWAGAVKDATLLPRIEVTHAEGRHVHLPVDHGWQVEIHVQGAKSTIDLEGLVEPPRPGPGDFRIAPAARPPNRFRNGEGFHDTLGKLRYHRSEQDWAEAGSPTAEVHIVNERGRLHISADVHADRSFVPPETVNRLDNEQADINGAGIQLYLRSGYRSGGYVIVPIANSSKLSMRPIDGWGSAIAVEGSWREIPDGYHVDLYVSPPDAEISVAFAINEKPHGRERRRGQFVVPSSDSTEWIYLRGDRMPSRDMINIRLERD